jgi:hypothetical protein
MHVYGLCGILPEMVNDISINDSYVQIFPNPSNGIVTFNLNLPNNMEKFKLTIYNSAFQIIEEATIHENKYLFDISRRFVSSGTYLFDLRKFIKPANSLLQNKKSRPADAGYPLRGSELMQIGFVLG